MKNPYSKVNSKSVIMETTNIRVSDTNPLAKKTFPGDKRIVLETDIQFYNAEDNDKSDSAD